MSLLVVVCGFVVRVELIGPIVLRLLVRRVVRVLHIRTLGLGSGLLFLLGHRVVLHFENKVEAHHVLLV